MKTLAEINKLQRDAASQRWRLILELSRTMTLSEIGRRLGLSRSRVCQLIRKARDYYGENGEGSNKVSVGLPDALPGGRDRRVSEFGGGGEE